MADRYEKFRQFDAMPPAEQKAYMDGLAPEQKLKVFERYKEYEKAKAQQAYSGITGKLASVGRGGAQGFTGGFSDEIGGVAGALGSMAGAPSGGFTINGRHYSPEEADALFQSQGAQATSANSMDAYRQARDEERQKNAQAQLANPNLYRTGEFGGALLQAAAIPGGAAAGAPMKVKMAEGAMLGAGIGTVSGLGYSDADLTTMDPDNYAQATADAAFGGLAGTAFGGLSPYVAQKVAASRGGQFVKDTYNAVADKVKSFSARKGFDALAPGVRAQKAINPYRQEQMGEEMFNRDTIKFGSSASSIDKRITPHRMAEGAKMEEAINTATDYQNNPLIVPEKGSRLRWSGDEVVDSIQRQAKVRNPVRTLDDKGFSEGIDKELEFVRGQYGKPAEEAVDAWRQAEYPRVIKEVNEAGRARDMGREFKPSAELQQMGRAADKLKGPADIKPNMDARDLYELEKTYGSRGKWNKAMSTGDASKAAEQRTLRDLANQELLERLGQMKPRRIADIGDEGVPLPNVKDDFARAQRSYGLLASADDIASEAQYSSPSRRPISVSELAGGAVGTAAGYVLGNDQQSAAVGGALGTGIAFLTRTRGNAAAAVALRNLYKVMNGAGPRGAVAKAFMENPGKFGSYAGLIAEHADDPAKLDAILEQMTPEAVRSSVKNKRKP